ncbi:MAG: hypothetical protein WDZ35_13325 [Crocinitomicaceae bacterium]
MAHSKSISDTNEQTLGASGITLTESKKKKEAFSGIKWLDNIFEDYEFNRYGIYAVLLLVVGCMAGIAVGVGAMSSSLQISLLVIPTMASLVMILAVAPMRPLIWVSLFAILVDIIMIVYNLLV